MDAVATHIGETVDLPRAGFWRRSLATLIDVIIVMLPFQILAAVLFTVTAGSVQMNNGFFQACAPAATVPNTLDPPPPHDSNFASACHVSFFGATTGSTLIVGRTTREGATTTTVRQGYMLDADGKPTDGTSIDWIVQLAFLGYLIGMIWKTGRTIGARTVGVRVVDAARPNRAEVPLGKVILRYLAITIGWLPTFAVLTYQRIAVGGSADAMFTGNFFRWSICAGGLAALWNVVLMFQIATKKDPVYDRLAGTAVLRG